MRPLEEQIQKTLTQAATQGRLTRPGTPSSLLSKAPPSLLEVNDLAARLAQQSAARQLTNASANRRDVVRRLVARGLREGWDDATLRARLAEKAGMDARQALSVENYRAGAAASGLPKGVVAANVRAMVARHRANRAANVAQSEVAWALAEAQRVLWREARELGELSPYAVRVTRVAPDGCKTSCRRENGRRRSLKSAQGGPPFHPRCRCYEELVDRGQAPAGPSAPATTHIGAGLPVSKGDVGPTSATFAPDKEAGTRMAPSRRRAAKGKYKKRRISWENGPPVLADARVSKARDGDGDGFVFDGTPRMRPYNPAIDGPRDNFRVRQYLDAINDAHVGKGPKATRSYLNKLGNHTRTDGYLNAEERDFLQRKAKLKAEAMTALAASRPPRARKAKTPGDLDLAPAPAAPEEPKAAPKPKAVPKDEERRSYGARYNELAEDQTTWEFDDPRQEAYESAMDTVMDAAADQGVEDFTEKWFSMFLHAYNQHLGKVSKARDGDGDGFVHDGTPRMRPWNAALDGPKLRLQLPAGKAERWGRVRQPRAADQIATEAKNAAANPAKLIRGVSEYRGWNKWRLGSKAYWTGKAPDGRWVAVDNGDKLVATGETAGGVLEALQRELGMYRASRPTAKNMHLRPATDESKKEWQAKHGKPIPPGLHDVKLTLEDGHRLVATGVKADGSTAYFYSDEHEQAQEAKKWARLGSALAAARKLDYGLGKEALDDDTAAVLLLMRITGIRVGSADEQLGRVPAYGATTLQRRHLVDEDGKLSLRFVGKEGVAQNLAVTDPRLVAALRARMEGDPEEKLFKTSAAKTMEMLRERSGSEELKNHDLRTLLANSMAARLVAEWDKKPPGTKKEFAAARKQVGEAVASQLGNNYTQALASYINPAVFAEYAQEEWL